jgi:hypothetical protein
MRSLFAVFAGGTEVSRHEHLIDALGVLRRRPGEGLAVYAVVIHEDGTETVIRECDLAVEINAYASA